MTNPQHSSVDDELRVDLEHVITMAMEKPEGGMSSPGAWGEADGYWITMHAPKVAEAVMKLIEYERVKSIKNTLNSLNDELFYETTSPSGHFIKKTIMGKLDAIDKAELESQLVVNTKRYSRADVSGHGSDLWPEAGDES